MVLGCSLRLDSQEHVSMCRGAHPDHSTFLVTYFFHFFVVSLYLCILAGLSVSCCSNFSLVVASRG